MNSIGQTPAGNRNEVADDQLENAIQPVAHQVTETTVAEVRPVMDDFFLGTDELHLDSLIVAVHAQNPSLQAAHAAWSAAAERYPQAIALEDPMLQTMFAPATFPSGSPVESSYYIGGAQKIPWYGKRGLRGQIAQGEANAAEWNAEEVKLRLALATRMAFFDLYLVNRELDLSQRNVELMQDFRASAKSKYEANQVSEQDLSAADLELAKLQQQRLELEQTKRTAIARINTLLHRCPDDSLPPPPQRLVIKGSLPDASDLRERAVENRPELGALSSRIQSEQNAVALACKEYYPDFEFMGRYDAFWTDRVQRSQVGMNMNVPLNTGRRGAAVREAQFRLSKLMAEHSQQQDAVREEVQIAHSRVFANQQAAKLYGDRILPAAQTNLDAARAAYIAGSIDFLRLMEARRQFNEQQIAYQRTLTEYHRSRSDLERAVGAPIDEDASPQPHLDR
jgi:cobalt-zinc-cadmium efflux system outer membrane protein